MDQIPSLVQALADKVHLHPIAWCIHPSFVVIVFEEGPKLTFDRTEVLADFPTKDYTTVIYDAPKPTDNLEAFPFSKAIEDIPIIHNPPSLPALQKLPVKTMKSKGRIK